MLWRAFLFLGLRFFSSFLLFAWWPPLLFLVRNCFNYKGGYLTIIADYSSYVERCVFLVFNGDIVAKPLWGSAVAKETEMGCAGALIEETAPSLLLGNNGQLVVFT
jgi:hypothetical protein